MVDQETLRRRLALLQDALADLRRYRSRFDARTLQADRDAQHMVLHALYIAAQAAIDIALHASADAEEPAAPTYQLAFARLASSGRLEPRLAKGLMGWAGLHNVLAHQLRDGRLRTYRGHTAERTRRSRAIRRDRGFLALSLVARRWRAASAKNRWRSRVGRGRYRGWRADEDRNSSGACCPTLSLVCRDSRPRHW